MSKAVDVQRKALGKGLSALLPQKHASAPATHKQEVAPVPVPSPNGSEKSLARMVPVHLIRPNPNQPRQDFSEGGISELAQSIRINGIIQPITVCETANNHYLIVAGERRWRAAKEAGLSEVPVFIRNVDQDKILELALIENIQREDLNPIETALAFEQLIHQHHLTHEQVAERTGKDRSTITNFVRLLRLTPEVRDALAVGKIAMGHARALLGLDDSAGQQQQACKQVIAKDLSVRETEQLVKRLAQTPPGAHDQPKPQKVLDPNTRAAIEEMAMSLGTKVRIVARSEKSGRLEIEYYSVGDLQRIYEAIVGNR
jgi:ParB family transcriptional regulator, chromosome partitioning protein